MRLEGCDIFPRNQFFFELFTGKFRERFDARFALLTPTQREAVASALTAYEVDVAGTSRQEDVTDALDSYWRSLTSKEGAQQ